MGELRIAANLTISGDKAYMYGARNGGYPNSCVWGPNPGLITTVGLAQATFQTDGDDPFEVYGDIDVQGKVVNNARFGVQKPENVMKLSTNPKSGSGVWFSKGGLLEVDAEVSGSATWSISDDADAVISIKADCTALTGDVDISKGLLQIDANFCTTGDLTVEGVNNHLGSDAGSRVWVAREKSASFGGSCE
ncbi:MAG TPA: hypothetical protein PKK06_12440 [Phycisphaerae bacterium]|nr:hypothetical protein [Phycisphaerae bacterium]HNU45470.1 hypothetical protein [Phycisphaerae bacterium]